ncbi:hypothetical protein QBC34DRAFT_460837 [Podospora aff. communis PSN243]|uniref:Peptidase metallopeptidase domain-containing protein n=1 Tax=Podospora aff. communis PSN243 TaxID=3040156 RepID=A0AAV9GQ24_9PEZI|nr:hypothetical protein QBC34DRAFT_460837 [Podospora aff. communis PSN243]
MATEGNLKSTKEIIIDEVLEAVGEHTLDTPLRRGPSAIMVGLNKECPRWVPGSVIKWVALKEGFKTDADAAYAANQLHLACEKWNELNIGVTFEWVTKLQDASFALCHGGDNGSVLASAFFPNGNDLNMMLVYNAAFSMKLWSDNMWKVFTHELGHVLGLRHEFALDINPETGAEFEAFGAVRLGPRNPLSVMAYRGTPPEFQEDDVKSTRAFYALNYNDKRNPPMVGLMEVMDYEPI